MRRFKAKRQLILTMTIVVLVMSIVGSFSGWRRASVNRGIQNIKLIGNEEEFTKYENDMVQDREEYDRRIGDEAEDEIGSENEGEEEGHQESEGWEEKEIDSENEGNMDSSFRNK